MDVVIPTCGRIERLIVTITSLINQQMDCDRRLILLGNNGFDPHENWTIRALLSAARIKGWITQIHTTKATSISSIKLKALTIACQSPSMLLDEDVFLASQDTLSRLLRAVTYYDADAASPIGFELDDEHPMLNECASSYSLSDMHSDGCSSGHMAVGCCLLFTSVGREIALQKWCAELPYMEDQLIVHFIKRHSNYVLCHDVPIIHLGKNTDSLYCFDNRSVINFLTDKVRNDETFRQLLKLRECELDGADFHKPLLFRKTIKKGW